MTAFCWAAGTEHHGGCKMDIAHIIGFFSPEHGGPPVSLRNYAMGQQTRGHAIRLYTLEGFRHTSPAFRLPAPIRQVVAKVPQPERLGASKELRAAILADPPADIYHLHGIWMRPMYYASEKAKQSGRPYLIEINGALDPLELKTKPWRKRIARWMYQDRMIHEANCLHVNSEREAVHLRELGFNQPMVVIPAGFNLAEADALARQGEESPPAWAVQLKGRRVLLYLARVFPGKGIDDLIDAWAALAAQFPDWDLVIVGPGTPQDVESRKQKCAVMGIDQRCHWIGLVPDRERAWAYRKADLYVLPSHKENFGNTVQEALGYGTPVLTTTATPWLQLEAWQCGWVCDDNVPSLTPKLASALQTSPADLRRMGTAGRRIIETRFSLDRVVDDQLATYEWMRGGLIPRCLYVG